jgi:high-affinity iron transporter
VRRFYSSIAWACVVCALAPVLLPAAGTSDGRRSGPEALPPSHLLVPVGNALVDSSDGNWDAARRHLDEFGSRWQALHPRRTGFTRQVDATFRAARSSMQKAGQDGLGAPSSESRAALSRLAVAVDAYVQAVTPPRPARANVAHVDSLNAGALKSLDSLQRGDIPGAASALQVVAAEWLLVENGFRTFSPATYASFEIALTRARAAFLAVPPDPALAEQSLGVMLEAVNSYRSGPVAASVQPVGDGWTASGGAPGPAELLSFLRRAQDELERGNRAAASARLQDFVDLWPTAEGEVRTRSAAAYARIENQMTKAGALLLSSDAASAARAREVLKEMTRQLVQVSGKSRYTIWDAAVILFREGMEALLVLAALLAMMRKSDRKGQVGWVWAGAGTGIALSGILAVVLVLAIASAASGSAREMVEGIVGLASVALMLSVGAWLHRRSSLQAWNTFIKKTVGRALANGGLWSIFALACLAVLREGAESVVFFIGIASGIPLPALLGGIAGAVVVLAVIGYLLIRYSVRLPLHWFFLAATILIYSLAFKITGESLHSLQVAGTVPTRYHGGLPTVGLLGLYPTWETFIPQMLVLCLVLAAVLSTELHRLKAKT